MIRPLQVLQKHALNACFPALLDLEQAQNVCHLEPVLLQTDHQNQLALQQPYPQGQGQYPTPRV